MFGTAWWALVSAPWYSYKGQFRFASSFGPPPASPTRACCIFPFNKLAVAHLPWHRVSSFARWRRTKKLVEEASSTLQRTPQVGKKHPAMFIREAYKKVQKLPETRRITVSQKAKRRRTKRRETNCSLQDSRVAKGLPAEIVDGVDELLAWLGAPCSSVTCAEVSAEVSEELLRQMFHPWVLSGVKGATCVQVTAP